jgi:hypothetical protein
LFAAAAERQARTVAEVDEPDVTLRHMTSGGEVIEDYRHVGLSLRRHPVEFLRADLAVRRVVTCADAMASRDGRWLEAAGLVLVLQRPGSAKGVLFITIEDETGVANLVVWPSSFEKQRLVVLSAGMMSVRGKIQREGAVVHLVAHHLTDLSEDLASVGERDGGFPLPHGRGDQIRDGGSFGPDQRDLPQRGPPDARYLYPGPSHRFDQGEDAGLPVGVRKPHLAPCFRGNLRRRTVVRFLWILYCQRTNPARSRISAETGSSSLPPRQFQQENTFDWGGATPRCFGLSSHGRALFSRYQADPPSWRKPIVQARSR